MSLKTSTRRQFHLISVARLSPHFFAAGLLLGPMACSSTGDTRDADGTGASAGTDGVGGSVSGSGGAIAQTGGTGPISGGASSVGGTDSLAGGSPGVGGGGNSGGDTSAGGANDAAGGSQNGTCAATCLDQCTEWGGTEKVGTCDGAQICCEGATIPNDNPLAHLVASAEEVGLLLANRFSQQNLSFSSVSNLPGDGYKSACEWYGSLGVAKLTESQALLDALVNKFDPFATNFVDDMKDDPNNADDNHEEPHVDRYIFGMVPLEIYLQVGGDDYLEMGVDIADHQQVTNQTRDAIDDMFMMTGPQLQAYRATGEAKYINFMAQTMIQYLGSQQPNGLFFHNENEALTYWGRGNGWFAAGMAEMMRDLPTDSNDYPPILEGYMKMMAGLLPYQSDNGLWYQVLDMPNDPNNWEESSGSAMFTYAMVAGVRRGILDAATYVPVIEAAWAGLLSKISAQGDVSDICVGTWYQANPQAYMALTRLTGDGHGQAPILWIAAELLR